MQLAADRLDGGGAGLGPMSRVAEVEAFFDSAEQLQLTVKSRRCDCCCCCEAI